SVIPPTVDHVKVEEYTQLRSDVSSLKVAVESIQTTLQAALTTRANGPPPRNFGGPVYCSFCSGEHFIRNCNIANEYIASGKCKRNHENKVVLPSGAFIPSDVTGNNLKERIDEWHRRNPEQQGAKASHMMQSVSIMASGLQPHSAGYTLSLDEKIISIEAELYALKARREGANPSARSGVQTRSQANRNPFAPSNLPATAKPAPQSSQPAAPEPTSNAIPEHPFRDSRPVPPAVAPPVPTNPAQLRRTQPAYQNLPPIYNPAMVQEVFERSLKGPIQLTHEELLALSPEIRSQYRDKITTKRIPPKDGAKEPVIFSVEATDSAETPLEVEEVVSPEVQIASPTVAQIQTVSVMPYIAAPSVVSNFELRPIEVDPSPNSNVVISAESIHALRAINPIVNNTMRVECILDSGCQIVAMSEAIWKQLGLPLDPTHRLNMESANGSIDQSLGLARNVSFDIGGITFYLQVHVLREPAYDVLIGRPLDVLAQIVTTNFVDGTQNITLHDPNSDRVVTIPTKRRSDRTAADIAKHGLFGERFSTCSVFR
ncbi:hypothetical protein CVT24_006142, partial [Panaeolus cyanescens]